MGMTGALAGLGQGLIGFADMMNKNAEQDRADRREIAAFERQKSLERLRATNQMNLQKSNQEFQGQQSALDRTSREGMAQQELQMRASEGAADREARIALQAQQDEAAMARIGATAEVNKQMRADERAAIKQERNDLVREQLDILHSSDMYTKAPEAVQKLMDLQTSMTGEVDLKNLMKTEKLEAPTAEHMKLAMETLSKDEAFSNQKPSVQLALASSEAVKMANPNLPDQGKRVLPDSDVEKAAQDFMDGKITGEDLVTLNTESRDKLLKAISEIDDHDPPATLLTSGQISSTGTKRRGQQSKTDTTLKGMLQSTRLYKDYTKQKEAVQKMNQ